MPTAVEINGIEYPINSDFRTCLRIILAFEDEELTNNEKAMLLLDNLYPEIPHDQIEATRQGMKFLNGGKVADEDEEEGGGPRLYSFEKDANLIFAAFRQTHGIDLETVEMHFWKFLALFMDLGSETTFCQLIGLRKRVKSGKATKEEKEAAREMGDAFLIEEPDDRTPEEREKEAIFDSMMGANK